MIRMDNIYPCLGDLAANESFLPSFYLRNIYYSCLKLHDTKMICNVTVHTTHARINININLIKLMDVI